jgi:outer membrane receptor protein involved in Fe transport
MGYRHIEPISQGKYDYGACPLAESGSGYACSGSGTTTSARFITSTADTYLDPKTNLLRDYNGSTDAYNYGPSNSYQREDTRYTAGAFAHYQVTPKIDIYSDFMFMDDTSTAQLAPSGLFGQTFTIPCNNTELTASELSALCNGSTTGSVAANITRRNVEGGDREEILKHQEFREVLGARGDLDSVWHYDVSAEYTQATMSDEQTGDVSLSKAQAALSNCSSAYTSLAATAGCVPYNIFSTGGVTQAALNYIETPAFETSTITQQVVDITLSGDLGKYGVKSPWATDGVSVAGGASYRREALNFSVDSEYSSGDLAGSSTILPVSGSYDVYELFGEMRIPVISDKPFVKDLSIDGAYRFSDYSTVGSTSTYSVEANYSPNRDVRFRVSWNRAERAPNITELFTAQSVVVGALTADGCSGAKPTYTAAQCANTGVTAAQYGNVTANSASQYNGLAGGNPDLQPEVANTYSGGIVFTPHFIPNLSITLDYFNIFVSGVIESISPQNTLDDCATTGSSYYCSLVHRSTSGSLWLGTTGYVSDLLVNAGSLQTSGADLQVDYRWKIPQVAGYELGRLSFNFDGTYLASLISENEPGSGQKYNCAGFYGATCSTLNGAVNPVWRHKLRATWVTPWNFEVSGQWRYIGSVRSDGDIAGLGDTVYAADSKLPGISYLDMTVSMKFKDHYTFRFGCKNVLDQDPPTVGLNSLEGTLGNGNTFPGAYDTLGRNLFAGLTADF